MTHRGKIAAGVVGVMVLAVAAVPFFVNVNTFRPVLEQQLTTAIGRQVKLGELSLSLFSGSVVAKDLSVADDPKFSSEPFVSASALRIGVEMRPLIFDHKIFVRSLEVEAPQIHLVHSTDGNVWNFSTIGQTAASRTTDAGKESVIPDLTVNAFSLKDGHATVENLPAKGTPLVYDKVNVTVQGFSFAKQFPFTVSAELQGQGTLNVTGKAGPIDAQDAAKTTFDAQVVLHHFDPVSAGFLDKSSGISVLEDVDAHAASNGTAITSNGTLHTQRLRLRPDAVPAPKPIDITYTATHNLSDNTGQVQDAAFQTGKLAAHVSGGYAIKPDVVQLTMKLTGKGLPIDELQALLPAVGVKLPNGSVLQGGTLTTNLNITGPVQNLVIAGPVELSNTRLSGFNVSSQLKGIASMAMGDTGNITNIQSLRVNLQVTKAGVNASNLYTSMPAIGEAVGKGTVSPGGALNFDVSLKVDTSRGIGGKAVGLLTALNGTAGQTAAQTAKTGVPVKITGTSSQPIITPDVSGMLKSNASAILGNQKANGKQLLNKLGGLFGKK